MDPITVRYPDGRSRIFTLQEVEELAVRRRVRFENDEERDYFFGAVAYLIDGHAVQATKGPNDLALVVGDSLLRDFESPDPTDKTVLKFVKQPTGYEKRDDTKRPQLQFPAPHQGVRILSAGGWTPHQEGLGHWHRVKLMELVGPNRVRDVKDIYLLLGINSARGDLKRSLGPTAPREHPATQRAAVSVIGVAKELLGMFPEAKVFYLGSGDLSPTPKRGENPVTLTYTKTQVGEVLPALVRRYLIEPPAGLQITPEQRARIRPGLSWSLFRDPWPAWYFQARDPWGHWSYQGTKAFADSLAALFEGNDE